MHPIFEGFNFSVLLVRMKSLLLVGSTLIAFFLVRPALGQTLPASTSLTSPVQFLGYELGERFTPHHQLLAYAEEIARQRPNRVKLMPYGKTYEGRQLMLVVVASEANLNRLETIRTNNLNRIGLPDDKPGKASVPATTAASGTQPGIAWLSYNVHGNEAVSSESFMEVLYELVSGNNGHQSAVAQKIMNSAVVILDPGLNPDGHDRYVNWYNQMMGRTANVVPFAREHTEPWPGGRFTHYLFDPNRDWAWQTQETSQQRMAMYQHWMPQLHADFHEMGVESPYYFAPSAKPYHEDITPFQRDFQQTIGKYSSRAFDKNGWLYYSRERYDLLYPSYGDTYPTYNGAIGMTFEQGGGGRAGVAIQKADGDTLTLRQRISHHVATSFATLEAFADRAPEVLAEFGRFFDDARNKPIGTYKSYVVKANGDLGRLKDLQLLLDRNKISYGYAGKAQTQSGFNYGTQQTDKSVSIDANDMVISAYQPKSTLLKILFEPTTTLEDSATYDITAWSLPYAYGLQTYGLTTRLTPTPTNAQQVPAPTSQSVASGAVPYAYLVQWQSMPAVQMLAGLLSKKVKVRAAEKPFEVEGKTYPTGTLLITRTGNERFGSQLETLVRAEATRVGVAVTPVQTGFATKGADFGSGSNISLKAPRVGLVVGDGTVAPAAGEIWHYFDRELQYPITLIDGNTLGSVTWSELDVLILPSNYNYGKFLTERNLSVIKTWIQAGGKLIALERAASFLAGKDGFDLKEKKEEEPKTAKKTNPTDSLKVYGDRERQALSDDTPGSIYRLTLDSTHPLAFGLSGGYYSLVQNTFDFDFLKSGWNVGYLKSNNYVAGFVGKNARPKLRNTLVLGVQDYGSGSVVYLADDPLFRGFWYGGKLLFGNAVFMVGN